MPWASRNNMEFRIQGSISCHGRLETTWSSEFRAVFLAMGISKQHGVQSLGQYFLPSVSTGSLERRTVFLAMGVWKIHTGHIPHPDAICQTHQTTTENNSPRKRLLEQTCHGMENLAMGDNPTIKFKGATIR